MFKKQVYYNALQLVNWEGLSHRNLSCRVLCDGNHSVTHQRVFFELMCLNSTIINLSYTTTYGYFKYHLFLNDNHRVFRGQSLHCPIHTYLFPTPLIHHVSSLPWIPQCFLLVLHSFYYPIISTSYPDDPLESFASLKLSSCWKTWTNIGQCWH